MRGGGHCNDRLAHPEALAAGRHVVDQTDDPHAVQFPPDVRRIVVEHGGDPPLAAVCEFLDQVNRSFSCAQHGNGLALDSGKAGERALLPHAVGKTAAAHQHNQQNRIDDEDGTRHGKAQHHEGRQDCKHRDGDGDEEFASNRARLHSARCPDKARNATGPLP